MTLGNMRELGVQRLGWHCASTAPWQGPTLRHAALGMAACESGTHRDRLSRLSVDARKPVSRH